MPDESIRGLESLLRALARERSLRGRLRVLGRAWTLLRSLSPAERDQVAMRLGSRWAWRRVEKAFLADGELDESERLVGQAFERLGRADPRELRDMARAIRRGDVGAARDSLLLTLTEALEEEAGDAEAREPEPEPEPRSAAEPEPEPEPPAEPRSTTPAEVVDSAAGVLASVRARATEPIASGPRVPEAAGTRSTPAPPPARAPASTAPPSTPPEPRVPPPAEPPDLPDLPSPGAGSGGQRLRVLRDLQRQEQPGADLGRTGRATLLESLGGGWASRRALSRMIAARSLDGADEALDLIGRLLRPAQQAWCLADLIAHWQLAPDEVERVLAAAPSDAARRRLLRRCAAHPDAAALPAPRS